MFPHMRFLPERVILSTNSGALRCVTSLRLVFTTAGTGEQSRLEAPCGGCYVGCADT